MSLNVLAGMRVFAAVVEAGSFAGAADKLTLSRGMATRYVAQLEAALGARLLNRTTRHLSLTEAGSEYYQRAVQVLGLVEEAGASVAEGAAAPRGTLRVSAPVSFGARHLGRAITTYLRRHPEVEIDLTLNDRAVDLVEEGFDLAIRIGRRIDDSLIARKITRARMALCAAPAYLKAHGTPRAPADLARHNCISYAYAARGDWRFRRGTEERSVRVTGNMRGNNGDVLMEAAIAGLGVIRQPTFLAHEALRRKQLVRLLPRWEIEEMSVYAVYPNRKHLPPKVRSFIDHLCESLGPEPYWDGG